jgi:hypothetical protein
MCDDRDEDEELPYEGAQCCRCDLDLDRRTGMCPNDRCPFHVRYQDEIVAWSPPDEDEEAYIEQIRARLLDGR